MPKVFISYARSDGEEFATSLKEKIEAKEPEIELWMDRAKMHGGLDWWRQICEAIEWCDFLALIVTPGAVQSKTTAKEWRYARQLGKCVCPVKGVADAEIAFEELPKGIRKGHFYDTENEWDTFINYLKSPCQMLRVPFMAPSMPEGYVQREEEFNSLKQFLLSPELKDPVAITTSLIGAGGFGKTTLATALCNDQDILNAFDDGILWVTLGQTPNLQNQITKLYRMLTGTEKSFIDVHDASINLSEALRDRDCLLVIDDVWNPAHLKVFMQKSDHCAYLITSRLMEIAQQAHNVEIDEMTSQESIDLLSGGMELDEKEREACASLAKRLGEWPILLELAAARLRQRMFLRKSLKEALVYLNTLYDRRGVTAFDQRNPEERNQAVIKTLEISLELLNREETKRYKELAIFPKDLPIPVSAIAELSDYDDFETEELLTTLSGYSLIKFDPNSATVNLHNVVRTYLEEILENPASVHRKLVKNWGDLYHLPNKYAWNWLSYHLIQMNNENRLRELLIDYRWIKSKLEATSIFELSCDYDWIVNDKTISLLQSALRQSSHVLRDDKTQLASQLWGRLFPLKIKKDISVQMFLRNLEDNESKPWMRLNLPTLSSAGSALIRTLIGHRFSVNALVLTPDSRRIISGSDDNNIKIWDLERGEEIMTLFGHRDWVNALTLSADGKKLVSGSSDNTVRIWNLENGEEYATLHGHNDSVNAVLLSRNDRCVISCSSDRTIKIWDIDKTEENATFVGHRETVNAIALTNDGRFVFSGSDDESIKFWDLENGEVITTLDGLRGIVSALAITPDGRSVLSGYSEGTIEMWEIDLFKKNATLKGHSGWINALAITPDNKFLISASDDKTLKIWDLNLMQNISTLTGHSDWIISLAISKNCKHAISGSHDRTIKVWDIMCDHETTSFTGHSGSVRAVATTPDGKIAISCSEDKTIKTWDLKDGKETATLIGHKNIVQTLAVTPNGMYAISGSSDWTLKVWDLHSYEEISTLGGHPDASGHADAIRVLAVSPDGTMALSGSDDKTIKIWDLTSHEISTTMKGHNGKVNALKITPDGRLAVSSSEDMSIIVWNLERGEELYKISGHNGWINALSITPDCKCVITGSDDNTIKIWNLKNGQEVKMLTGHISWVNALSISPDGTSVVSGSDDNTIKVWDLESGKERATMFGHTGSVYALTITPDNKYAISSSEDNCIKVWDLTHCEILCSFQCNATVYSLNITLDGKTIVAGDAAGNVHFFKLENV